MSLCRRNCGGTAGTVQSIRHACHTITSGSLPLTLPTLSCCAEHALHAFSFNKPRIRRALHCSGFCVLM
jgi:hypothetical protein